MEIKIQEISLQHVLPEAFASRDRIESDVWHQEVVFKHGETYLLSAASGTGKSSLCSYLYGMRNDYQGLILFDGKNIRSLQTSQWTALRTHAISMLFQDLRLFPELTTLENIRLKNQLTHYQKKAFIKDSLERLGIGDKLDTPVGKLSFGQQQRVALVRALCQPFDFICLDEPISHLDDANAEGLAQLLREEADRQGAGIIVTSVGKHLPMEYTKIWKL